MKQEKQNILYIFNCTYIKGTTQESLYQIIKATGKKQFSQDDPAFGDIRKQKISKKIYLSLIKTFYKIASLFTYRRRKKIFQKDHCKSILVILLGRIGDMVLALPFLESLRFNFPEAKITLLGNHYTKDILLDNPHIDHLIAYDDKKNRGLFKQLKLILSIRKKRFGCAYDLSSDYTIKTAFLTNLINPHFSVGYNTFNRGFLFNQAVDPPREKIHQKDIYLHLLKSQNITVTNNNPKIYFPKTKTPFTSSKKRIIIGVAPGGFYESQCWIKERFAITCDLLVSKYDAKIILLGGPGDLDRTSKISSMMKKNHINAAGKLSLLESIKTLAACDILMCHNSGLLHMACALGVPTVSLMGPTVPERWWPLGENNIVIRKDIDCSPCNKGTCPTHECMSFISENEVLKAIALQINLFA